MRLPTDTPCFHDYMTQAVIDAVAEERCGAEKVGRFNSSHEAWGVIEEEWDELKGAIHANDAAAERHEALQLAAMALRLVAQHDAKGLD